MKLKICQVGEPVLRELARPLSKEEILSRQIQELIEHMHESMLDAPGVGLAAPQIGLRLRLAVIEDQAEFISRMPPGEAEKRQRVPVPFHVIINPKLTILGDEIANFFEGCLSLAGYSALVRRALNVRVEALNEKAEPIVIEATGWYARILQHEIDHLNGTIYIDRMQTRSFMTLDNFNRHWKDVDAVAAFEHRSEI